MAESVPILLRKDNTFTKLFVGGLPYHTTDDTLRAFFSQHGEIEEAVVIYDRNSGKSKGYGFVTMATRDGAESACMNPNPIVDGRKANVNLAYLGAKPRNHSQPSSPLVCGPARSDSPSAMGAGLYQQSPPGTLPISLQAQAAVYAGGNPMGVPMAGFYEGSPPFSPPPPGIYPPPFLYSPYFPPQYPGAGLGYGPPGPPLGNQQFSPMVPYNVAN